MGRPAHFPAGRGRRRDFRAARASVPPQRRRGAPSPTGSRALPQLPRWCCVRVFRVRSRAPPGALDASARRNCQHAVMFRHVVLLHLHDDTPDDAVEELLDELRRLPGRIPEIRSYVVGRDARLAADNATVAVVADFDDEAGYLVYRDHAAHLDVITRLIRPRLADRAAVQHPVDRP